jgi:hypothetical protein
MFYAHFNMAIEIKMFFSTKKHYKKWMWSSGLGRWT